jgi:hypothetical protein
LGRAAELGESKVRGILNAVLEVATPVIFGVGIIILVFLPLMTLQGMEGKMFAPLAYTIAIALAVSLVTMREAIDRVSIDRTLLIIAHRLSTVVDCDQIIVLENGKVVGIGTHSELVTSTPLYRDLAKHQLLV